MHVNGFQLRITKIHKLKWPKTLQVANIQVAPVSIIVMQFIRSYVASYTYLCIMLITLSIGNRCDDNEDCCDQNGQAACCTVFNGSNSIRITGVWLVNILLSVSYYDD